MNVEKAVVELTDTINHAGLNEQILEERDLFLCLITIIFISVIEKQKYDKHLNLLFGCPQEKLNFQMLSKKLESLSYTRHTHKILYQELIQRLKHVSEDKRNHLLNKTSHIPALELIQNITRKDAIDIYSHILQRLQAMNMVNKLSPDFQYQDIPPFFSDLVSKLANKKNKHSIYDPYALTGELAAHYAANNDVELVTAESVLQSSSYLCHMFCIGCVNDIQSLYSFGLAPEANIQPMIADVAFTLLDPTASKEDDNLQKDDYDEIMLMVDDGRIKEKTVPTKFKEHGFVQHLIYSLKNDGLAIMFMGKGPLHREVEKQARTFLLQNNYVDAVIELPSKLIKPRTVTLFALVLKKQRTDKLVRFVNASDCYTAAGRTNKLINLDEIHARYSNRNSIPGQVAVKSLDEIMANDCLLMPSIYLSGFEATAPSINLDKIRTQLISHARITDEKLDAIFSELIDTNFNVK